MGIYWFHVLENESLDWCVGGSALRGIRHGWFYTQKKALHLRAGVWISFRTGGCHYLAHFHVRCSWYSNYFNWNLLESVMFRSGFRGDDNCLRNVIQGPPPPIRLFWGLITVVSPIFIEILQWLHIKSRGFTSSIWAFKQARMGSTIILFPILNLSFREVSGLSKTPQFQNVRIAGKIQVCL